MVVYLYEAGDIIRTSVQISLDNIQYYSAWFDGVQEHIGELFIS